jgi:hypothetical protein
MQQAQQRRAAAPAAKWADSPPSTTSLEEVRTLRELALARRTASFQAFCRRSHAGILRVEHPAKVQEIMSAPLQRPSSSWPTKEAVQ